MTDTEILKKAIEKAEKNGWFNEYKEFAKVNSCDVVIDIKTYFIIIFSHDFAKAFFGEKSLGGTMQCLCGKHEKPKEIQEWMMHIQLMVLEKEPLKYLEKFI